MDMRKWLVLGAVLVLSLVVVSPAAAWRYRLPFWKAENSAKRVTRNECAEDVYCVSWGVHCRRLSEQRVNCLEATWDEPESGLAEPGEYLYCSSNAKYGIGPGGYITTSYGNVSCRWVYEP